VRRLVWLAALSALGTALALASGAADSTGAAGEGAPAPPSFDQRALARALEPPLGLPSLPLPPGNPPTVASIHLGRKLFLDRRLSVNGTLSCAMCHVPERGFTVNELQTAVGLEGRRLRRNAPTLLNVAYAGPFFHDGREPDLDLQPLDVLVNPDEMAAPSLGAVAANVRSLPDYGGAFEATYGASVTVERVGQAIATYLRTLLAAASPFDRWRFGGEAEAVPHEAGRGYELFVGRAGCGACHAIASDHALFTDHGFHDTGIGWHRPP
jgi:cytochrome c peroxidase